MKKLILTSTLILTFVLMSGFKSAEGTADYKHILGTWTYEAPDAPYEYQEGEIIFEKKEGNLIGYVMIDGYKIDLEEVKAKKEKLTFDIYVEGELVSFDMTVKKKKMTGTATYSEGSLEITGTKK